MDVVTLGAALSIMKKMPDTAASSAAAAEDAADRAEAAAEQAEGAIEVDDTLSIKGRAADAKAVGDQIGKANITLNKIINTTVEEYSGRESIFDDVTETAVKITGSFVQTNGAIGTSAIWNYYSLPVSFGDIYRVSAYQSDSIKTCLFLNESNEVVEYYPSERDTNLTRYTFTVTVPNNAVVLIVNERVGTGYIPSTIEKLINYKYTHTNEYNVWKAEQNAIRLSEIDVNVSISDITEKAGYYITTSGSESQSNLWRIMSLAVNSGDKYKVTSQFYGGIKGVFFFDENDHFISPYYGSESDDILHTLDVVVPQNAVKMSINDKKSRGFAISKYIKPINNDYIIVNGKTLEEIVNSFGNSGNVLYGKTLVTVGDSITYGADMDSAGIAPNGDLMTYGWQIANRNAMTFFNCGISGSTIAAGTNRSGFAEPNGRYTQLPDNIDYLTIFFGWNDYACIADNLETLGSIDSTDINSYYGAYNTVIPYLIDKYPDTRIGLIVPFGASAGIRQAVRDLAQKWGLGYFDNYKGNTPLYYGKEDETVLESGLVAKRRAKWQANGAHPSYAGHCQLATQIESWLRSL